jgi:phosphoglycerol transferase
MQTTNSSRVSAAAVVLAIMVIAFVLLMLRSSGIYPTVLGDEYTYSSMARLLPFSRASIPNYLYLLVFKSTLMCGDGFMACAKLYNTLFFVAAAPFIYLTARRFCSVRVSVLIVALSMLGPINSYTAYFMPEAMFFFSFWVSIAYFLSLDAQSPLKNWAVFGFIVGCSSLVKPHALFAVPAFCVCILFFAYKGREDWLKHGVSSTTLFLASLFATKFVISYALAGKEGLTLFGNFYSSTLESNAATLQRYVDIFLAAPHIVAGHLLANILMFGCAVVIVLVGALKALSNKTLQMEDRVTFCTLMMFMNLIAIVALFSASVAGSNAIETALRLHMRYYDFLLPLLFIAAGSQIGVVSTARFNYYKWGLVVIVVGIIVYAAVKQMEPFTVSAIDNPELRGYTKNDVSLAIFALMSAIAVIIWYKAPGRAAHFFVFWYLPLSIFGTTAFNNKEIRNRVEPDAFDKAGLFARSYLPASEFPHLLVVGDNPASILRTLFFVEDLNAGPDLSYVPGVTYTAAQTAPDKKWILIVGDVDIAKNDFEVMKFNGYSLAKKIPPLYPLAIDMRTDTWPNSVDAVTGLSHPEPWGTWSDEPKVEISFKKSLPQTFELTIAAKAFGPNAGQSFDIEIEGHHYPVQFGEGLTTHTLKIENPTRADQLTIRVPAPTSPKQLALSEDGRTLGLGLEQLVIRPVE